MTTIDFRLPDVGEGIAESSITTWYVDVGDNVAEDQVVVSVETDKSIVELPSPVAGRVAELRYAEGDSVEVGETIVVFETTAAESTGQEPTEPEPPSTTEVFSVQGSASAEETVDAEPFSSSGGTERAAEEALEANAPGSRSPRVPASPFTRRLARELGVELNTLTATGPHGRVLADDVRAATETPGGPRPTAANTNVQTGRGADTATVVPVRGLRRTIADSMTASLQIPHVTEWREIDATNLLAARAVLREQFEERGRRFSFLPLLLQTVVRALKEQPSLNATYDPDASEITQYSQISLGVATATEAGLIVPVIRSADAMGVTGLASAVEELAEKARNRTATAAELTGGTFTVTNFGSFGTWLGTPIIRPPEVGIVGFGRVSERVIPVDGRPEVRPVLPVVAAADHRINDGAELGSFMNALVAAIEQPYLMLG